jgi:ThiF family
MYTWIQLNSSADLTKLQTHISSEYEPAKVSSTLANGISDAVKAVLIEANYIDKDYRSTFYNFYAKKGQNYRGDCVRLHFFDQTVSFDSDKLALRCPDTVPIGNKSTSDIQFYDRQIRMFGKIGQERLSTCRVGVVGLGGIGSLVVEYLARIGVRHFVLIDDDKVEASNLSRIVGASPSDAVNNVPKTAIAKRLILQCDDRAEVYLIEDDVAKESVARRLVNCDYLFLAADSKYSNLDFFEFLRTGDTDIYSFAESLRGQRRPPA